MKSCAERRMKLSGTLLPSRKRTISPSLRTESFGGRVSWRVSRSSRASRNGKWASKHITKSSTPATTERSEEHTSELQSLRHLVCRLLLEKKKATKPHTSQMKSSTHREG